MVINEREYPVVVQAYQPSGTGELFVAEQLVHTQAETDNFTSRYAGYVIKARVVSEHEIHRDARAVDNRDTVYHQPVRRKSGVSGWAILLLLLIALAVVGFTTGWIQRTFDVSM